MPKMYAVTRSDSSLSYPNSQKMPACVPGQQNNAVADINANTDHKPKPPGNNESTFNKIISCLFWKKKTDVVDMKKDSQAMRRQKMTVDRSERSRRVLKMETTREVPQERAEGDSNRRHMANGTKQMFLPSENPTASFLSNLNPSVRRACSDVIRSTSNPNANRTGSREAFGEGTRHTLTRNTDYRAKRLSDREPIGNQSSDDDDKPPPLPSRNKKGSMTKSRKPIVVPGTMMGSDDDVGYNTENDIDDLHDELRRMNISHPDLRDVGKASSRLKNKRREGSISLSEGNGSGDDQSNNHDRPQNPAPNQASKVTADRDSNTSRTGNRKHAKDPKNKSMEQVIDELFVQTQSNIDSIYQNGLENMDELETFRCETATPDTCMKRLENDLLKPSVEPGKATPEKKTKTISKSTRKIAKTDSFVKRNVVTHGINGVSKDEDETEFCDDYTPEMDSLLTEVSTWAKDRQSWLLEDSKLSEENTNREDTETSFKTDDRVIDQVLKSNSEKPKNKSDTCTDWIDSQNKRQKNLEESKMNGILTGPKLFRTVSRNNGRKVSFNEKRNTVSRSANNETRQSTRSNESVSKSDEIHLGTGKNVDLTQNSGQTANEGNIAPWSSDMYTSTPRKQNDECDRETLDDNLSELEERIPYRARSPDSWLSSIGSCTNLKKESSIPHNDSFDAPSLVNNAEPPKTPKKSGHWKIVSDPAKSHQIIRQAPKIHTPFKPLDREVTPMPTEMAYNPVAMPLVRNTQLQPLNKPQRQDSLNLNNFPTLSGMKNNDVMKGTRTMDLEGIRVTQSFNRPFSEIPLRTSSFNVPDRNSNLLSNSIAYNHDSTIQYVERPNSETIGLPPKRHDKIGMGQVMATDSTKERTRYAKEIVNSIQKQKPKPQDAFIETSKAPSGDRSQANDNEQGTKNKRHKVFDNSLLKGGYNYEKHSRRKPPEPPTESAKSPRETVKASAKGGVGGASPSKGEIAGASISELTINFKDSGVDHQYGGNVKVQGRNRLSGNSFNLGSTGYNSIGQSSVNDGNKMAVAIGGGQKMRTPPGKPTNHGLLQPQLDQTAGRFKRLRNRRDQEMDWLMRDAAETEV